MKICIFYLKCSLTPRNTQSTAPNASIVFSLPLSPFGYALDKLHRMGQFREWLRGDYSVISQAMATRTRAVIAMKMTIEPNKTTDSLMKWKNLIFGSFVVLYTTEIDNTSGSSHSMDCGVTPIRSGVVKVANTKAAIVDILFSEGPDSSQVGPVNGIDNTQKIEQPGDARVNLPDFARPAVNGIIAGSGYASDDRDQRGVHNLGDVPGLRTDGIDDTDRADIQACGESKSNGYKNDKRVLLFIYH